MKNKNQDTDSYGRDKRPKTEKLKRKDNDKCVSAVLQPSMSQ